VILSPFSIPGYSYGCQHKRFFNDKSLNQMFAGKVILNQKTWNHKLLAHGNPEIKRIAFNVCSKLECLTLPNIKLKLSSTQLSVEACNCTNRHLLYCHLVYQKALLIEEQVMVSCNFCLPVQDSNLLSKDT
jgi:hypothetical protein